jgi:hypothetical protein
VDTEAPNHASPLDPVDGLLLTRDEAAVRAGVTHQSILAWERAGRLHPTRSPNGGQGQLIRASELDRVARSRHRNGLDPLLIWRPEELDRTEVAASTEEPPVESKAARYW